MWAEGKWRRSGKEGPLDFWLYSKEVMGGNAIHRKTLPMLFVSEGEAAECVLV